MKLKNTLLFIFILNIFFSCLKSKKYIDETNQKIYDLHQKIYDLHQKIKESNQDSIPFYLAEIKNLFESKTIFPDSLLAENNFLIGKYFHNENSDSTLYYYNKAVSFSTNKSQLNKREFDYLYALTMKYYHSNDYINALSNANLLEKKTAKKNVEDLGRINNSTSMIYVKLGDFSKALQYNDKSILCYKQKNKIIALNSVINLRSKIYNEFGKKDSAKIILNNLLKNNKTLSPNNKYQSYNRLGIYYFTDGAYNKAKENYFKALFNAKKTNYKNQNNKKDKLANCYNNIAETYLKLNKFKLASNYLDSTFLLGIQDLRETRVRNFFRYNLQLLYDTKKDIKPVLDYLDKVLLINRMYYKKKMENDFLALSEANKHEKIILKQKQESELRNTKLKNTQLFIIIITLLTTIIGILYYRKKKIQFQRDELMLEQRLFRAQMNPHFTSNILYNIQNLFKTDSNVANDYLIKFSRLLRLNLENSIQNFVLIEKEIEAVEKYLELQKLRFPNTFNYKISGNCIDDELLLIPPMLIQPFVENAIEHGFKNIDYMGFVSIQLNFKNNYVFCEISDNGSGISKNKKTKNEKKSSSTQLIKKLIKKITKKDVIMSDNSNMLDQKGTMVQFYIPFKEK